MSDRKTIARKIFLDTLAAIDIPASMAQKLAPAGSTIRVGRETIDLSAYRNIVAISIGKAAVSMARGFSALLPADGHFQGVLVTPRKSEGPLDGWKQILAGHPTPNEGSFQAGREILELVRAHNRPDALIFFLLSGGGSSLCELPLDVGVTLENFVKLHHALVTCGAPIEEINAVRKHLSAVKGGRLAAAAPQAMKITLGVTDVPEGHETALASGPTLPDPTTVDDARRVAGMCGVLEKLSASLRMKFEAGELKETPKPGDAVFARAKFELLLGRHDLFHHAHIAAEAASFLAICDNSTDGWPVEKAAAYLVAQLEALALEARGKPVALIADGEVSSPVTGNGTGGRNSAFVLACVERIAGREIAVLSGGTDGIDGNSPAAGAVADGKTLERARAAGVNPLDYFQRSDAFMFFDRLGDALIIGHTGNNLRDLRILLCG